MSWINRLVGSLRKNRLNHRLDDELRFHIEMRAQEFIAAGMTPDEARYRAQRIFGNQLLLKERTRDMDTIGWIETLGQDLYYAGRMLRKMTYIDVGYSARAWICGRPPMPMEE